MLIHENENRSDGADLLLACLLAFIAGGVNSVGFIAYGYFSANMTGNVSLVSETLSVWELRTAFAFSAIVLMFIFGAFLASLFIQAGKRKGRSNIYALTLISEAVMLVLLGVFVSLLPDSVNGSVVVGLLALTMGVQNAASTRISGSRVRTTHVSGLATDIGVGLASLCSSEQGAGFRLEVRTRLRLHGATVSSFIAGGVAGALSYSTIQGLTFCLFGAVLFGLGARYLK